MLLKLFANACDGTFIGIGRWMRSVKDTYFAKQHNRHTAAFSLTDLRTQFLKQAFDVALLNVGAGWSGKDELQRALVFSLHRLMVPLFGTFFRYTKNLCLVV